MNAEIKAQWITDLTSGNYKQGFSYLKHLDKDENECFCVMGVLTDQYIKTHPEAAWIPHEHNMDPSKSFKSGNNRFALSDQVMDWANMKHLSGEVQTTIGENDEAMPFSELANKISGRDF